jgi:hypothetical protein
MVAYGRRVRNASRAVAANPVLMRGPKLSSKACPREGGDGDRLAAGNTGTVALEPSASPQTVIASRRAKQSRAAYLRCFHVEIATTWRLLPESCSPDGAKRNPGLAIPASRKPGLRCAPSGLHAGAQVRHMAIEARRASRYKPESRTALAHRPPSSNAKGRHEGRPFHCQPRTAESYARPLPRGEVTPTKPRFSDTGQ